MERVLYCDYKNNDIEDVIIYKKWINKIRLIYDGFYLFFTYEYDAYFINIQPIYFEKDNFADIIKYEVSIKNIKKLLFQVKINTFPNLEVKEQEEIKDFLDKINNEISKCCFAFNKYEGNIIKEKMIYWNQKHLKKINEVNHYFTLNDKNNLNIFEANIEDYIESTNYCYDNVKLRIFNVGEANCCILKVDNKNKVLFDFGNKLKKVNKTLNEDFENMNSLEYIVVSHFHCDHINQYLKLHNDCFINTFWFIPEKPIGRGPICMENLYSKLMIKKSKVFVIKDANKFYRTPFFEISKGNGKHCTLNYLNENSLICHLNYKKDLLIPGDATYDYILLLSKLNDVDYLIIPHHGCKYSNIINTKVNILSYSPNDSGKRGSISNRYRHPQINHLNQITSEIVRFGEKVYYFNDKIRLDDVKSKRVIADYIDIDLVK